MLNIEILKIFNIEGGKVSKIKNVSHVSRKVLIVGSPLTSDVDIVFRDFLFQVTALVLSV